MFQRSVIFRILEHIFIFGGIGFTVGWIGLLAYLLWAAGAWFLAALLAMFGALLLFRLFDGWMIHSAKWYRRLRMPRVKIRTGS